MNNDIYEIPPSSPNFHTELAKQLAEIAPEAIADGKVDVDKLKELLNSDISENNERFGLFWPGKKRAIRLAQESTTATLKPDFENSKDWDTTENIFIEGDNLEVLKVLQRHYYGKIKVIYIDPPYNTGQDFVYKDSFGDGVKHYLEWTRQVGEEGKSLASNVESEGRYHSNWLNMMYPRLKLARNLLADDGIMFISIDNSEASNLEAICNEIFGESNLVTTFVIDKTAQGANQSSTFKQQYESLLLYKRRDGTSINSDTNVELDLKKYKHVDKIGRYAITNSFDSINSPLSANRNRGYTIYYSPSTGEALVRDEYDKENGVFGEVDDELISKGYEAIRPGIRNGVQYPWNWVSSRFLKEYRDELVFARNRQGEMRVYHKNRATGTVKDTTLKKFDTRKSGNLLVAELLGGKYFDYPKSVDMLKWVVSKHLSTSGYVLDFFSGSATTAHAVMQLNAEDGGTRRHIQVQLPEPTPEKSQARNAGFDTIAALSRERIRQAGEYVKRGFSEELSERDSPLDVGFRAYTLSDSNFSKWRVSSEIEADELKQQLFNFRDTADDSATEDELFTEILLKQGFSLTERVESRVIAGLDVHALLQPDGDTAVIAYLNEHRKPSLNQLREMVGEIFGGKLVILEDAFQGDDELKTNLAQLCKTNNVEMWTA